MSITAKPITARPLTALRIGEELSAGGGLYGDAFVLVMETTTAAETVTIPCQNNGVFNATIDWGDETTSTITAFDDADLAHEYATAGEYTIQITGDFPNIYFNNGGDKLKLKKILNWGDTGFTTLFRAFWGCATLTEATSDGNTNMAAVTSMGSMFNTCSLITTVDASNWDTSSVTDMTSMFAQCRDLISLDVSGWNVSSVTSISTMFRNCTGLTTIDVSGWDTSSLENANLSISGCSGLTGFVISGWDITSLTAASGMLSGSNNALTTAEYDAVLVAWEAQVYNNTVTADFGDATYTAGSAAATARAQLVTDGWTITDGGSV